MMSKKKIVKLTESQLRHLVEQVLAEDVNGPAVLKAASGKVIAALNADNPATFWSAVSELLEGLIMSMDLVPGEAGAKQADEFKNVAHQLLTIAGRFKVGSSVKKPTSGTFKKPEQPQTKLRNANSMFAQVKKEKVA